MNNLKKRIENISSLIESWCKKKIVFSRRFCPSGHMTQNGGPKENAIEERVNGILKDETFEKTYFNYGQAVKGISVAISIYSHQRPQGSIDYLTPIEAHF